MHVTTYQTDEWQFTPPVRVDPQCAAWIACSPHPAVELWRSPSHQGAQWQLLLKLSMDSTLTCLLVGSPTCIIAAGYSREAGASLVQFGTVVAAHHTS